MQTAQTSSERTTVAVRMGTTVRKARPRAHVRPRPSVTVRLARRLNVSERHAKDLLYTTFPVAAAIVEELSADGELDRLADLMAPLTSACAAHHSDDMVAALRSAQDADSEEDRAEMAFLLERSPANARALLHAKARAVLREEAVMPLLREVATR
jgi:hypothetical protein